MIRLSRTCYDKAHRCPGWAGGGMKYAKGGSRCDNGRIYVLPTMRHLRRLLRGKDWELDWNTHPGAHPWRFGRCTKCNVVTWPHITRLLSPSWWR